ncbi:hypothetical protein ACWD5R_43710 [Streptomyces sp. NPDC002514]
MHGVQWQGDAMTCCGRPMDLDSENGQYVCSRCGAWTTALLTAWTTLRAWIGGAA